MARKTTETTETTCKHVFVGIQAGVQCIKCHRFFTAAEYSALLTGKKEERRE